MITFPNTEKKGAFTTLSGVHLTNVEVFGKVVKHSIDTKTKEKTGK